MGYGKTKVWAKCLCTMILPLVALPWAGADVINQSSGTETYNSRIDSNSTINLSGTADATFNGKIGSGTEISVYDSAISAFNGELANNVVIDLYGGTTTVNSIKNNATINVSGGTLLLNQSVGNGASVNVSSGSLELGADDIFPNNGSQAALTMSGGSLQTNGYNVEFESLTLDGDSVIDLGNNPDILVNLGSVSGSGTLTVVNWVDGDSLTFDPGSSSIDVSTQIMFSPGGAVVDPNDPSKIIPQPIPEPTTVLFGTGLVLLACGWEIRRRRKQASATA